MTISTLNMIQRLGGDVSRRMLIAIYFGVFVGLLGISVNPAMGKKLSHPVFLADLDGDGKKDNIYRSSIGRRIEFGVTLTKYNNKYVNMLTLSGNNINEFDMGVERKEDFIESIKCSQDCSPTRMAGIAALKNSISPEVFYVQAKESAGSAIFMNAKGKLVREWYSD